MRESIAAVALITTEQEGQVLWLARWNPKWERYYFVSGHRRPEESFRACVVREVSEELNLREGVDFTVLGEPLAHVEFAGWSKSAQTETFYQMELFEVRLTGDSAWQKVDVAPLNRWLTETEICSHQCRDGKPVSSMVELLLSKIGWCRRE